jgi:hypothetical protein
MNDANRQALLNAITAGQLAAIEPLIDELIRQASEQRDIEEIGIPFHAIVQLITFLKFHEWHEARPGYVSCPECKIEFQATLPAQRHHRAHCRVGELIKFLQAKIKTSEGSKHHAES